MSNKDTGGWAFPTQGFGPGGGVSTAFSGGGGMVQWPGMTLRDWFAGMAVQGLIANKANPLHFQPKDDAAYCYSLADAMLKERAK